MKARPDWESVKLRGAGGSVLIEVMVAIMLVAVLVVPLATGVQSAIDRAEMAEAQMYRVGDALSGDACGEAWEWGAMVTSALWQPGPTLRVEIRQRDGAEFVVGLWADGWFMGEHSADSRGSVCVSPPAWSAMTGREVVVRVRESGSDWGPPWRTVVPDAYGNMPRDEAAPESVNAGTGAAGVEASVAHVGSLANPLVVASWTDVPGETGALGLPFFLAPSASGLGDVTVEDHNQTWWMDTGRFLDLYF